MNHESTNQVATVQNDENFIDHEGKTHRVIPHSGTTRYLVPDASPCAEVIHGAVAFYVSRQLPEHLEPKPYRATLIYAASSSPHPGGEIARIFEAAETLTRGRDEAGAVWFDWDKVYGQAKRGGLDAVLELAGGDPWGFRA